MPRAAKKAKVKLVYTGWPDHPCYQTEDYDGEPDVLLVHAPFHGVYEVQPDNPDDKTHPLKVQVGETFEVHHEVAHGHDTVYGLEDEHQVTDPGLLVRTGIELHKADK